MLAFCSSAVFTSSKAHEPRAASVSALCVCTLYIPTAAFCGACSGPALDAHDPVLEYRRRRTQVLQRVRDECDGHEEGCSSSSRTSW